MTPATERLLQLAAELAAEGRLPEAQAVCQELVDVAHKRASTSTAAEVEADIERIQAAHRLAHACARLRCDLLFIAGRVPAAPQLPLPLEGTWTC